MAFNTIPFFIFFLVFYSLYALTLRRVRVQNVLLLVSSYVFYGWWDWRFLGLIMISTLVDYACGLALDRVDDGRRQTRARKWILTGSIITNLGILGFFKYYNFFLGSAAELLTAIGLPVHTPALQIVLPIGISFYTFQTLSYTIDVYRGKQRAHRNLLEFAVFVAFFPQLAAGPIVRASEFKRHGQSGMEFSELLPQLANPRRLQLEQIYQGGYLILWGLFKKVVIADGLAGLVDRIYDPALTSVNGGAVLVATYAFAVQIYCDFSGYTDIARGLSKWMGLELPLNFRLPYFATNPSDFWRRWHITLSQWIRDYLYIPLGGSRCGSPRAMTNLMIAMGLCGLWHGASWTCVVWGLYHGLLLMGYHILQRLPFPAIRRTSAWVSRFVTFHLVCLGWLVFRAESLPHAAALLSALATAWPWWIIVGANTLAGTGIFVLFWYALPLLLLQIDQHRSGDLNALLRMPAWARGFAYTMMVYGVLLAGARVGRSFIYFQF